MQFIPFNDEFFQSLRQIDHNFFLKMKAIGCPHCKGRLDTANYPRKPRGLGENETIRFSLCCRNEGCRKRLTPKSVRFFDRKVYSALVVILALDFHKQLGLTCKISRQTLLRWHKFWKARLAESHTFMRWARGFLPPGWPNGETPACFFKSFSSSQNNSWISIIKLFIQYNRDD